MPLARVMCMAPSEYDGWVGHLHRYPPLEYLTALLWFTVTRGLGNDQAQPSDVGNWLESASACRAREERSRKAKQAEHARRIAAAHIGRQGNG